MTQIFSLPTETVSKEISLTFLTQAYQSFTLQHFDAALLAYEKAISADPVSVEGYRGKGRALWQLKCYSEALASFARADTIVAASPSLPVLKQI